MAEGTSLLPFSDMLCHVRRRVASFLAPPGLSAPTLPLLLRPLGGGRAPSSSSSASSASSASASASSSPPSRRRDDHGPDAAVVAWLQSDDCPHPMSPAEAAGVANTLRASPGMSVSVSSARALGAAGLKALAGMAAEQAAARAGRDPVEITVRVPHERHTFTVAGYEGDTVQDLQQESEDLARYFECACGGNAACSTCHVIVDADSFAKLEPASRAEEDMLDYAYGLEETSRLGCQIKLTATCGGMVLTVPDGVNNMW